MVEYEIVAVTDLSIVIIDLDIGRSVTNDTRRVIKDIDRQVPGGIGQRNVYYRDTQGRYDMIMVKNGKFNGFAPCSFGQQKHLSSIIKSK